MREFIFKKCANFLYHNYRFVFWIMGFFFLAFIGYLCFFPPKVETDILGLLPQKDPVVIDFKSALDDFKSIDHLFILIKLDAPGESMEDYFDDIDELVKLLPCLLHHDRRPVDDEGHAGKIGQFAVPDGDAFDIESAAS